MSDFKVGDRVIHTLRGATDIGVVEKILDAQKGFYLVRFANPGPSENGTWKSVGTFLRAAPSKAAVVIPVPASLKLLAGNTLSSRPVYAATRNDEFRSNPVMRNWETSYTKKVVDALTNVVRTMVPRSGLHISAYDDFQAAINLLRDYHATQHVVYDQRDQARQQVKQLRERIDELTLDALESRTKTEQEKRDAFGLRNDVKKLQAGRDYWKGAALEFADKIDAARAALKR